jgi:hypothetical protein
LATYPRAFFDQWCQKNSEKTFFFTCRTFPTLGGLPPSGLFLLDLCGTVLPRIYLAAWAKACLHCQQSNIHLHAKSQPRSPNGVPHFCEGRLSELWRPLFRRDSSDIWLSFPNSMCRCCICLA